MQEVLDPEPELEEEVPFNVEPEGLPEVPDPEPELEEEVPFEPEEDPVTDLSASFTAYRFNPFEPRPETRRPYVPLEIPLSRSTSDQPEPITMARTSTGDVDMTSEPQGLKEIKLNYPKPFSGKREQLKKFIQDCGLYMLVNKKVYDNDLMKIAFVLVLMNEGDAAAWKEQMLDNAATVATAKKAEIDLGMYKDFMESLVKSFEPYDAPGDALEKMKALQMKPEDSIDDHVAKFKMLVSDSGIKSDSPVIMDFFRQTLPFTLQRRILALENAPKTIAEWYKWATTLDHSWKRMQ